MGPRTSCRSAGACFVVAASAIAACVVSPAICYSGEAKATNLDHSLRPRPREAAYLSAVVAAGNTEKKLAAAAKLADLRAQDIAASLVLSLNEAEPEVRVAVAEALGSCGNRGTVPWLILSLGDSSPKVAKAAHAAIERLTGRHDEFDADHGTQTQQKGHRRWSTWFCRTDWDTIETDLIAQISTVDFEAAREAIEALSHVAGDRGRFALLDFVARDGAADESLRLAALRALGDLRDKDAVPLLRRVLEEAFGAITTAASQNRKLDPEHPVVRLASVAIESLDRIGSTEAEQLLRAADQLVCSNDGAAENSGQTALATSAVLHHRILAALRNIEALRQRERLP